MTGYVSVKNSVTLCSAQALTGSYVATATLGSLKISGEDAVALEISYTTGAAETNNTLDFKIEYSHDAATWFQEQSVAESSGVRTFTDVSYGVSGASAATTYKARHVFQPVAKHFRVQVKESGVAANFGTVTIVATKGSGISVGSSGNVNQVLTVSLPNEGQQTMANSISVALASDQSNVPVSLATLIAGEDITNNKLIVEDRYSYFQVIAVDTQIKASSGYLKSITFSCNDAAPTAGSIIVYDNAAESGTQIFNHTFTTTPFVPFTVMFNCSFSTGLYIGFTTTNDVNVSVSYR